MGNDHSRDFKQVVKFEEFLDDARTGDIMLFSGEGTFSDIVRATSSMAYWSHCGIVVKLDGHKDPYLFESTKEEEPRDELTNTFKTGPKLVSLRTKIETYGGLPIAYRRLHTHKDKKEASKLRRKMTRIILDFAREVSNKPYEENIGELIGAVWRTNEPDTTGYFCTELLAETLKRIGVLNSDYPDNDYQLGDFDEEGILMLANGYTYSSNRYIS